MTFGARENARGGATLPRDEISKLSARVCAHARVTAVLRRVVVTHAGACPQTSYPNNCKETLTYDVACQLGGSSSVTLPILIDAAPTNNNRTATLAVKVVGQSTQYITGTLESSSSSTLPATPCAPPTIDPYVTLPDVF